METWAMRGVNNVLLRKGYIEQRGDFTLLALLPVGGLGSALSLDPV